MMSEPSNSSNQPGRPDRQKRSRHLRRLVRAALFAALLCLMSPMAIPVGPVSVTLGLFAVLLTGALLGPLDGCIATLLYLFLGAVGLPVFSGANAGFGVLVGPTGGYLWSYPLVALLVGALTVLVLRRTKEKSVWYRSLWVFLSTLPGVLLCYLLGTIQYTFVVPNISFARALVVCVVPFIAVDLCKCLAVAVITPRVIAALGE